MKTKPGKFVRSAGANREAQNDNRIRSGYARLFDGSEFDASDLTRLLGCELFRCDEARLGKLLEVQSNLAKGSLYALLNFSKRGKGIGKCVALGAFVKIITSAIESLRDLENEAILLHPKGVYDTCGFPQTGPWKEIHIVAGRSEYWPSLVSTNRTRDGKRFDLVNRQLGLGRLHHRKLIVSDKGGRQAKSDSVIWRIAKDLWDTLDKYRAGGWSEPGAVEAMGLKSPIDKKWCRVARIIFESRYGDNFHMSPAFKCFPRPTNSLTKDKPGNLKKKIWDRVEESFLSQKPKLEISYTQG